MKRILTRTFALILVAMLATACGKKPAAVAPEKKAAAAVKGRTATIAEREVPRFLHATGQLIGRNDAEIAADAVGKVMEAPVERGTEVAAGDVLVKLDDRQAKLGLAEAEAALEMAQARLLLAKNEQERNAPLAKNRAIAEADFQRLRTDTTARDADVAAAAARRDMARKTLTDSVIRAPFAGVVAERMVEPGEYVKADSKVARVVDLATLRLVLNVPETEVGRLAAGQTVEFTTAAFPGRTFKGTLKFLGAAMREASRDLVVEAEVENRDGLLRPGFFCNARIRLSEEKAAVAPAEALRGEGSRRRLFVVAKNNTLSERLVEIGETIEGFVEIRRGAATGETVVLQPGADAVDGAPFEPAA